MKTSALNVNKIKYIRQYQILNKEKQSSTTLFFFFQRKNSVDKTNRKVMRVSSCLLDEDNGGSNLFV